MKQSVWISTGLLLAIALASCNSQSLSFAQGASAQNPLREFPMVKTSEISDQFVRIRAGTFQMGSPLSEKGRAQYEEALHLVTLTKDFEIQRTELTQAQWFSVMGSNPSDVKEKKYCPDDYLEVDGTQLCPNNPVDDVSWPQTQRFIHQLNQRNDGYTYRLPTEAEWEFASRGGTQTAYFFGDDAHFLTDYAWYEDNSGGQLHAVALKKANQYGLYDMYGNALEWVQDWHARDYPSGDERDPVGPDSGYHRVARGGTAGRSAKYLRSAQRFYYTPLDNGGVGFRLVRVPQ